MAFIIKGIAFGLLMICALGADAARISRRVPKLTNDRIVGGTDAGINEFPYQVSIQSSSGHHFCGGSILDKTHILTAAHCLDGVHHNNIKVVAGEWDLSDDYGTEQIKSAQQLILHSQYDSNTFANDIAIIRLHSPLEFGGFVSPISLPYGGADVSSGTICTVTGWGTLEAGGSSPTILQKVSVPIVTDDDCRSAYGFSLILDSMVCAGEGGKDSCQGDSGGPLYCGGTQIGVVSWGRSCADPDYPGVYTQISYYIDWIEKNMH